METAVMESTMATIMAAAMPPPAETGAARARNSIATSATLRNFFMTASHSLPWI
jgi:hypothetical protein